MGMNMEDPQNWGAAEPIRQAIHDLVSKFTLHMGTPQPSQPEQHADPGMVDAANQSFRDSAAKQKLSDAQASAIRSKANKVMGK